MTILKLKSDNNYNNIITKIQTTKTKKKCKIKEEIPISKGFSGDKVYKIHCSDNKFLIKKSRLYDKIPSSKEFFKYFRFNNKYSLLRELIVNLYLKQLKLPNNITPNLVNWHVEQTISGKIDISLYFEYINGISFYDLVEKNSYNGKEIISNKKEYIYFFLEFIKQLYIMNLKIGFQHNDFKLDNFIVHIDKNNKPKLKLIDFGMSSIDNLDLNSLKNVLNLTFWNLYNISKFKKRAYDKRSYKKIFFNSNKSHKIEGDIKFLIITFVQGFRILFKEPDFTFFNNKDIQNMKKLKYVEKLKYIIEKMELLINL
jgi:serine/threonine protein kinase